MRRDVERVSYTPVVRFTTAEGREIEFHGMGGSAMSFETGQRVAVIYDAGNPIRARIVSFLDPWLPSIVAFAVVVLFGGAVMTWARALGEFGATIIFAGNFVGRTQTMPLAIYQGFEQELSVALTLSIILLVVSFGVLFVVRHILHRQI